MKLNTELGEVVCPECKGIGNFGYEVDVQEVNMKGITYKIPGPKTNKICYKCQGTGKLDWVEAVVGKTPKTMPELKASDILSVQPMTTYTGVIFKKRVIK